MILEIAITATVFLTGSSCAAIDNETNKMVWAAPTVELTSTHYKDMGGTLVPDARYPNDKNTLLAIVHAEDSLQEGKPGRKIPVRCFKDEGGVPHEQGSNGLDHDHLDS